MRRILKNRYVREATLFNVSENSLFFLFLTFIKKILALISQISRYFEFLRRCFFVSREESVLRLINFNKFKSLNIILKLSFIVDEGDLNRFKIIEKD